MNIYGEKDIYIDRGLAAAGNNYCMHEVCEWHVLEGSSHWTPHDDPQAVNALIDSFL